MGKCLTRPHSVKMRYRKGLFKFCFKRKNFTVVRRKNPAYGRHRISQPMRILGLIQFLRGCMIFLKIKLQGLEIFLKKKIYKKNPGNTQGKPMEGGGGTPMRGWHLIIWSEGQWEAALLPWNLLCSPGRIAWEGDNTQQMTPHRVTTSSIPFNIEKKTTMVISGSRAS